MDEQHRHMDKYQSMGYGYLAMLVSPQPAHSSGKKLSCMPCAELHTGRLLKAMVWSCSVGKDASTGCCSLSTCSHCHLKIVKAALSAAVPYLALGNDVDVVDFAPQNDVQGHPANRNFVRHGGLNSTHEVILSCRNTIRLCFRRHMDVALKLNR